jgi:hopene-associated glycosyltransferase HpnB
MVCALLAGLALLTWMYLLSARGKFWRERVQPWPKETYTTPEVAIVMPARDEGAVIERSIRALIRQNYTGPYKIILVDDHSSDGTAEKAKAVAAGMGQSARLHVVPAPPLPEGWGGKLWAMHSGVLAAKTILPQAEYVLFTDADIEHAEDSLRELVVRAESGKFALTSFMVRLHCRSRAEKFLIPAFVFFFMMLYPFSQVRDKNSKVAAAAGGAMLARVSALEGIGGIGVLRNALIDDCTLAKHMKKQGPIWLGLSSGTVSIREYPQVKDIWKMIARSAYAQLNNSLLLLILCVFGMGLVFMVPVLALLCPGDAVLSGLLAYASMVLAFWPTVRFYGLSPLYALALPGIAVIYLLATLDSARRHMMGKGGEWKGRYQG